MSTKPCRRFVSWKSNLPVARKKLKKSKAPEEEFTPCLVYTTLENPEKASAASDLASEAEEVLAAEASAAAASAEEEAPEEVWLLNVASRALTCFSINI